MRKLFLIFISICFLTSCVPNKDLVYLRGNPVDKKEVYKLNNAPYRLQVDDVLSINIKAKNEESVALFKKSGSGGPSLIGNLQSGYSIDRHGNIRIPYIGEINVLGYTTKEVRIKLEEVLLRYLKNKEDIFVTVNLAGIKFTIFGEIGSSGTKVVNQNSLTIFEAIANSGDITVTGNRKKVELWRTNASGRKKYSIDLTKVDAFDSEIYYIQPNDLIYVVPLKQKAWGTGTTGLQSLSTIVSLFTLVTSTVLLVRNL
jgi:polysaccharide export outer membrane protein